MPTAHPSAARRFRHWRSGIALAALLACTLGAPPAIAQRHVRVNALGYAPPDPKRAFSLTSTAEPGAAFRVRRTSDDGIVFTGTAGPSRGAWGSFQGVHVLDFSALQQAGTFVLELAATGERSQPFTITDRAGPWPRDTPLAQSLLAFFRVQRCGDTAPWMHGPCHLLDATHIASGPDSGLAVNATGGWHDAGDYIKFLTTVAFTTHLLLWADEIQPALAGDVDGNGVSDLLDEARIGTDFLLRLRYAPGRFLYQVQDEDDHGGWRMAETDPLAIDRPAFPNAGKNHLGRYAGALARAARAFQPRDPAYAALCLAAARDAFTTAATAPDVSGGAGGSFYIDLGHADKMALGAIELHLATGEAPYLDAARAYADAAGPGYWFGWADVNGLAHALLAPFHAPSAAALIEDLDSFQAQSNAHPWRMAGIETWGTTSIAAGTAVEALLHERLTGDSLYRSMAYAQRDFILGANAWGVCFVGGQGAVHPRDFHHNVAVLVGGGELPGSVTEGPAPAATIAGQGITLVDADEYAAFQDPRGVYHDDRGNYVTNEPTITTNAAMLLLLALLQARIQPPVAVEATGVGGPGLHVNPNPAHGTARITFVVPRAGDVGVELLDLAGRRVRAIAPRAHAAAGLHALTLERTGLPPGLYFVRVTTAAGASVARVAMP